MALQTFEGIQRTPGACFVYYGDRPDWPIVLTQHRDSDMIERSNFEAARALLGDSDDVAVESTSHWAVGWVEYLLVAPDSELVATAEQIQERIADYPILDEDAYSQFTMERHSENDCSNGCDECEEEREERYRHDAGRCYSDCRLCLEETDDDE